MKRSLLITTLIVALGLLLFFALGRFAQMGPWMMGPGYGYGMGPRMMSWGGHRGQQYCPYCGSYLGPSGGYGMGRGMMGWEYQGYGSQYQPLEKPLQKKDAAAMVENYVQSTHNPNLKLGKIAEKDYYFEAEIVTKDNSLVDKILVDKQTGWMRSIY